MKNNKNTHKKNVVFFFFFLVINKGKTNLALQVIFYYVQ